MSNEVNNSKFNAAIDRIKAADKNGQDSTKVDTKHEYDKLSEYLSQSSDQRGYELTDNQKSTLQKMLEKAKQYLEKHNLWTPSDKDKTNNYKKDKVDDKYKNNDHGDSQTGEMKPAGEATAEHNDSNVNDKDRGDMDDFVEKNTKPDKNKNADNDKSQTGKEIPTGEATAEHDDSNVNDKDRGDMDDFVEKNTKPDENKNADNDKSQTGKEIPTGEATAEHDDSSVDDKDKTTDPKDNGTGEDKNSTRLDDAPNNKRPPVNDDPGEDKNSTQPDGAPNNKRPPVNDDPGEDKNSTQPGDEATGVEETQNDKKNQKPRGEKVMIDGRPCLKYPNGDIIDLRSGRKIKSGN